MGSHTPTGNASKARERRLALDFRKRGIGRKSNTLAPVCQGNWDFTGAGKQDFPFRRQASPWDWKWKEGLGREGQSGISVGIKQEEALG